MLPATVPLPALTAQLFPLPKVAQPPRIDVPVFAVMVLIVPLPEKSAAPPVVRVIAPNVTTMVPPAPMVELTAPTPLIVVPENVCVFVPAANPVAARLPPFRMRPVAGRMFVPPTVEKFSAILPPLILVDPP